jgi:hypothetical protein
MLPSPSSVVVRTLTFLSCSRFFKEIAPEMADFDSPFDTLAILAEVVSSDDEMLSLGKRKYFYLDFIFLNLYSPIFSRPPL